MAPVSSKKSSPPPKRKSSPPKKRTSSTKTRSTKSKSSGAKSKPAAKTSSSNRASSASKQRDTYTPSSNSSNAKPTNSTNNSNSSAGAAQVAQGISSWGGNGSNAPRLLNMSTGQNLESSIEEAARNGPISSEQAQEFSQKIDSMEAPTDPDQRAAFEQRQNEARQLLQEAQTPLLGQRMDLARQSDQLSDQFDTYGQLAGGSVAGNFNRLEDSMNGGQSSFLRPTGSNLNTEDRARYRAISEQMTSQARQNLREGTLGEQKFAGDFDQIKNEADARTEFRADQAHERGQQPLFPNFSERLTQLEQQQDALNQAYRDQGIDKTLADPNLAEVRSDMEGMDKAIADRGRGLFEKAGGLSTGDPAFGAAPVTRPQSNNPSNAILLPFANGNSARGTANLSPNASPANASPEVQKELDRYQDLRGRGIAPGDIGLSPQLRSQLGIPGQNPPNNAFNLLAPAGDRPRMHGDTRGADLSPVALQKYDTKGDVYDKNTQFPLGYSPKMGGMVRQLDAGEKFQTHLNHQPEGLKRQYSTRTLEQAGQFPNPDYKPGGEALVDSDTFHQRFTERQIQGVESEYQSQADFVKGAGGYDQALDKVRAEAREMAPPHGGRGGRDAYNKAYKDLLDKRMGHHVTAHNQATQELQRQALDTVSERLGVKPPTVRPTRHGQGSQGPASEAFKQRQQQYQAYAGELARLKETQLGGMTEANLAESQRRDLQAAMNVDRKELDGQWSRLGDDTIQKAAGQAWEGMSTEDRRGVMGQVAQERIDMARHETNQLHRTGLRNSPDQADRLQRYHGQSDERLDQLQKDLKAGKVEEVEAQLRRDVVNGSPLISETQSMDRYSAPQDRQGDKSFEEKTANMVDQRDKLYEQNGWWQDSPFYGNNDGAFMKDLGQRDMLAISPTDAKRGLETLQRLQQSDPAGAEKYQDMSSKLTRAYDLGRVGQQTAALDRHFGQVMDDQGVVGDFADAMKNGLGRPGGWVIDSNLGSKAVNGSLDKAYKARESIRDLSRFEGTDAEFAKLYKERVGALRDQLGTTEKHIGDFQQSQENWVEGISDVASVGAGLALTPMTGGAVWLAAPAAAAATKVGVKGLEAGTGSGRYQGNVGTDLLKGGVNGLSALGTSRAAAWGERAFMAGRQPGVASWLGTRAISAAEGATDGYLSGTASGLIDGKSFSESNQQGMQSALVGGVLAPAARTGLEAVGGAGKTQPVSEVPAAQQPSKLRISGDDLKSQGAAYLADQGLDPKLLDNVDIRTGDVDTPSLVRENGQVRMNLPADQNGRVLAHDFGHEVRHLTDSRLAFDGDGQMSGALREADQAYANLRKLREQGAPAADIAAAEKAYRNTSAELGGEAGGSDFVANYMGRLKETPKPKTGQPQDAEALGRIQQAQQGRAADLDRRAAANAPDAQKPLQTNENLRLANDNGVQPSAEQSRVMQKLGSFDNPAQLSEALKSVDGPRNREFSEAVAERAGELLGYGKGSIADLAANPEKMSQVKELLESADPGTRTMMGLDMTMKMNRELQDFSKGLATDPAAARAAFLKQSPQLEALHQTLNPGANSKRVVNEALSSFDNTVNGRRSTVTERQNWEPDQPQKRVDPNMTQEAYEPKPHWFTGKLPDGPAMIGRKMSVQEAEATAIQLERSLDRYAGSSNAPRPDYTNANLDNTYFSQGREPRVQFGEIKKAHAPGVEGYLKRTPERGPEVIEFPLEDGKFAYLMTDGHHRGAAQMMQGVKSFEDLNVIRMDQIGGKYGFPEDSIRDAIRNLHQHLYMTDTPVAR